MSKKIFAVFAVLLTMLPIGATQIKNVVVDTAMIKGCGAMLENTLETRYYMGRVNYTLLAETNDSIVVDLMITKAGTQEIMPIVEKVGDVGFVIQADARDTAKSIFFRVKVSGAGDPIGSYLVTVIADANASKMWALADSITNLMTPAEMQYQVCGDYNSDQGFTTVSKTLSKAPGVRVIGWRGSDGPHGIRWPLGPVTDEYIYGQGGIVTLFPTEVALGSSWDTTLVNKVAQAIAKEGRSFGLYCNLGPMVDLVINPRWGRAFETIGEDPTLNGVMGASMVMGLQAQRVISTPKHFAPYPKENFRDVSRIVVSERALRELFAVPFETAIKKGGALTLMACYDKVKVPGYTTDTASQLAFGADYAGVNKHLLTDIVRNDWGFRGAIMTDWGGISPPKFTSSRYAYNSDLDMDMPDGQTFGNFAAFVVDYGFDVTNLKKRVKRVIYSKLWACNGAFPATDEALKTQPSSVILSPEHKAIALEAARKAIVLARNEAVGGVTILPLNKSSAFKLAVVGSYSNLGRFGGGGSSAVRPDSIITPLKGIQNITAGTGVTVTTDYNNADVAVVVVGVAKETESEDRPDYSLPAADLALVSAVMAKVPKTIVVYTGGSASVAGSWSTAPGIIIAFYPGRFQGQAIAEAIFGAINPSGHLSVTFPNTANDLPSFELDNQNQLFLASADTAHGYFFFEKTNKKPLFWFGHGLSYTRFAYTNMTVVGGGSIRAGDRLDVMVNIKNIGQMPGDDVVQLYVKPVNSTVLRRVKDLRAFARVSLNPTEMKTLTFTLGPRDFSIYETDDANRTGQWKVMPGQYQLIAASTSDPNVLPDGSAVIQTISIN
jgi:beta-glucosidase